MALRELIVKITANSSSYQTEMARASRMGSEYYKTMEGGSRKAEAATRQSKRALAELNSELVTVKESASGMVGMFAGAFAVGSLISTADQYGQISSRIKMATGSQEEYNSVQQRLMEISDRTYKSIEEQSELYIRSANSMKELGFSTASTIDFIDSISSALTINTASAEKGESAINALSKSMVNGKVAGDQWHAVMEIMPTVIGDIARYLGTTELEVKKLGAAGKLSMDTFSKAVIAAKDRNAELAEAMPTTVGDAITKLSNHWKAYIGDANSAMGVTAAISGVIGTAADNIDVLVAAGTGLVGLGLARYFGGLASSVTSATGNLITATRSQLALAAAQVEGVQASLLQIQTERESAVAAQRSLVAQLQLAQTEKARASIRAQLAVNSAAVAAASRAEVAATDALAAAQGRLNIASGLASKALGLVGGPVGAAMLAAGAIYYFYEKSEQAKRSATELAGGVGGLIDKMREMGNVQLAAEIGKLNNSLPALSSVVADAQKNYDKATEAVERNRRQIYLWGEGSTIGKQANEELNISLNNQAIALNELTDAQDNKSRAVNSANVLSAQLNGTLQEGVGILKLEQVEVGIAAGMMANFTSSLNIATQAKTAFNSTSLILPVSEELKNAQKVQDDKLAILKLSGRAQATEIARQEAERLKITDPKEVSKFVSGELRNYDQSEQNKANEQAKSKAASATKTAESATKAYEQAIANLNKEIQIESVRLAKGEAAASLFAASIETGAKYTDGQRAELERLNKTLTESKQRWEDHNAAIASDPYRSAAESQRQAQEQLQRQIAGGEIQSAEELSRRKQQIHTDYLTALSDANQRYAVSANDELAGNVDPVQNLSNQLAKRQALIETYAAAGVITEQRKNQLILASETETREQQYQASLQLFASQGDLQRMAVDLFQDSQDRLTNMLTGLVNKTQTTKEALSNLFASLSQSIIKNLIDMAAQALITSSIMQTITGVSGGLMSGFMGGASGAAGTASSAFSTGAYSSLSFNAKGGVYDSPSLSAYSGQVVSSPTFFAFAKGAGVMGEAGPEAIMPLTRSADGSLGVRALTTRQPEISSTAGGGAPQVYIEINDSGTSSQSSSGYEQFGSEIGRFVESKYRELIQKDLGQRGAITTAIQGGR
ncbi:TPA: tape measure protein [Yersinia enterocolitica]|nr:phage tail tape measure protein [Yersinia enterocolitica]HDL7330087.1 phage tail tape measure protein [Yersinia enterocolitica]HDL7356549.1 phage tail tape measure protein [Yersinia enterocolitica]HDL7960162.1 phage tail tape measure protein [Yersinia enterocolitica]